MSASVMTSAVASASLTVALAAAAGAAPTVVADRACYSSITPLLMRGAGFTPGGPVDVSARWSSKRGYGGPAAEYTVTADRSGAFVDEEALPDIDTDSLRLTITMRDRTRAGQGAAISEQYASTAVTVAYFGAFFRPWNTDGPARGRPGTADVLDASGFIGARSRTLFIHYLRSGRLIETLRVGWLAGACAVLSTRLRQFDFQPVPPGSYSIRFDTTRTWPSGDMWSGYRSVVVGRRRGSVGPARRRALRSSRGPLARGSLGHRLAAPVVTSAPARR